jgi:hypothetical protein
MNLLLQSMHDRLVALESRALASPYRAAHKAPDDASAYREIPAGYQPPTRKFTPDQEELIDEYMDIFRTARRTPGGEQDIQLFVKRHKRLLHRILADKEARPAIRVIMARSVPVKQHTQHPLAAKWDLVWLAYEALLEAYTKAETSG